MLRVVIPASNHVEQAKPMFTRGAEEGGKDLLADGIGSRNVLHGTVPSGIILAPPAVPCVHHDQGCMVARKVDLLALPAPETLGRDVTRQVGIELLIVAGQQ